jgi:hypothetical protein
MKRAHQGTNGDNEKCTTLATTPSSYLKIATTGDDIITLNVGGTLHTTTRHILVNSVDYFPDSVLARIFRDHRGDDDGHDDHTHKKSANNYTLRHDSVGHPFIDADFTTFRHIINVLRRPALVTDVPPDVTPQAWCHELEYWGLVKRDDIESMSTVQTGEEGKETLLKLGQHIKKEIMDNEMVAIQTLLEKTGYRTLRSKTRTDVLYVPFDECALPWGCDLCVYLKNNNKHMTRLLEQMMSASGGGDGGRAEVSMYESRSHKGSHANHDDGGGGGGVARNYTTYLFDGNQYTTQRHTWVVKFLFSDLPTLNNVM